MLIISKITHKKTPS